jgi:Na+/melibiose symporter-like transporter
MEKSLCGVIGFCIASVAESDSQELGFQMFAWLSLLVSIVALAVSIKALRESRWIEIDWNFTDDDE